MRLRRFAASSLLAILLAAPTAALAVDPNACCPSNDCDSPSCVTYIGGNCAAGLLPTYCAPDGGGEFCCPQDISDCCVLCEPKVGACPTSKSKEMSCTNEALNSACKAPNTSQPADVPTAPKTITLPNPLQTPFLQVAIGNVARIMLGIAGTIALAVFVWGGVLLITSSGDPGAVKKAKGMMLWTAIGLVVMFAAEAIVRTVLDAILGG